MKQFFKELFSGKKIVVLFSLLIMAGIFVTPHAVNAAQTAGDAQTSGNGEDVYTPGDARPADYALVFSAEWYYSHNPDLQNALGNNEKALLNHFIYFGMAEGRQGGPGFNLDVYKSNYNDLVGVFGDNNAMYYDHFMKWGYKEGRNATSSIMDYSSIFNAAYYAENNADVVKAVGSSASALLNHFVTFGMGEGRKSIAGFDVCAYICNNEDLYPAFGTNLKGYYLHYMNFGKNEKRITTPGTGYVYNGVDYSLVFDPTYYAANNADVVAVYGNSPEALFRHFVLYGMAEGRRANAEFNVRVYRAATSNKDLVAAFGDNTREYYLHYMKYGKKENRIAN